MEVESHRHFLEVYRTPDGSTPKSDAKFNTLIAHLARRADELEESTRRLRTEEAELNWKVERMLLQSVRRAPEEELLHMSAVERQMVRVDEDKREEELKRQRDESQAAYARVHRKLASELSEMRDYRVYLQSCRQLRLEKLQESLSVTGDGRKLRAVVREMIRHGAQKVLQRLEQAAKWLEPWMCEVLANSCHLEIRIEDADVRLVHLRRQMLQPFQSDLRSLNESSKRERLAALTSPLSPQERSCEVGSSRVAAVAGAFESQNLADTRGPSPHMARKAPSSSSAALPVLNEDRDSSFSSCAPVAVSPKDLPTASLREASQNKEHDTSHHGVRELVPQDVAGKIEAAVAEMDSLRRLLYDMRHNAAAAVCHRVRSADRGAGGVCRQTREWGTSVLTVLVSEEFARDTMKAMQKSTNGPKRLTA